MHKILKRSLVVPILVACSVLAYQTAFAADGAAVIPPSGQRTIGPALLITPEMMAANEQALAASNTSQPAVVAVPFRSTVPGYEAAKAAIDSSVAMSNKADDPSYAGPLASLTKFWPSFEGVSKWTAGGWYPPDTEGAVGNNHFVEVTNSHIDIYAKTSPYTLLRSVSLNAFFGRTAAGQTAMFDPRCVYDRVWDRFVVMAPDFPDTTANKYMRLNLAISKTADPLGGWWIYSWVIGDNDNDFFDYPQLGMDWDGLIITANIFGPTGFEGAELFSLAKTSMYNGWGQSYWFWTGLAGTLAPPIVLDNNPYAFLVSAPGGNSQTTVWKYALQSSGRFKAFLYGPTAITVPAYSMPPSAPQPGTTAALDTLDARFVNVSTQVGNSLFQIHTVSFGTANAKMYEFDTAADTLLKYSWYYSTGTSSDWNASIAANDAKDIFVTWNSTDTANKVQVRVGGRRAADSALTDHGFSVFESPVNYGAAGVVNRWGDYSAVSLDPLNGNFAWFVNEKNNGANAWGTRIGRMGF